MTDSTHKDAVAARLREARSRLFDTAADAARALGIKPVTLRAHESGQNAPDIIYLERYARRYGVELSWLVTGKGEAEPTIQAHHHLGDIVDIQGIIMDGAWLPDHDDDPNYPMHRIPTSAGAERDFAIYTDPRFPAEIVSAWWVRSLVSNGPYVDHSIVFTVPNHLIGYRTGDHVVIVRTRKGFCEWTLREVIPDDENNWINYKAVLSSEPTFPRTDGADGSDFVDVRGVVIGSVQRRAVNELGLDTRKYLEDEEMPEITGNPRRRASVRG